MCSSTKGRFSRAVIIALGVWGCDDLTGSSRGRLNPLFRMTHKNGMFSSCDSPLLPDAYCMIQTPALEQLLSSTLFLQENSNPAKTEGFTMKREHSSQHCGSARFSVTCTEKYTRLWLWQRPCTSVTECYSWSRDRCSKHKV